MGEQLDYCKSRIRSMLDKAQTKIIFPIITLGLLREHIGSGQREFTDGEVRSAYRRSVAEMKLRLGHDFHIGGKYYDAYPSRNMPRYGVLRPVSGKSYELAEDDAARAAELVQWLPDEIAGEIERRLGVIPRLGDAAVRAGYATDQVPFAELVKEYMERNPTNFEVFGFAILKVHLERFACRIYRDSRASAHDRGVDVSTNFGVVYQMKKLKVLSKSAAESLYAELKTNFDAERLQDGNVILIIEEMAREFRTFFINMKVQSLTKGDLLDFARNFKETGERDKVLRVVFDEFAREYRSDI